MAEENKNLELSFFGEEKRIQIRRVWHSEKEEEEKCQNAEDNCA